MDKTRTIGYIDENEDILELEARLAATRTMEENFAIYCQAIAAQFAMMGIDVYNYKADRTIYFIEDGAE
jgi:hypothetical protein